MEDLSLHILDVVENSINANATLVEIEIIQEIESDLLVLKIKDNGSGMSREFLKKVDDPFTTTRTTRRVGLGIPFLKQAALETEGGFFIDSKENVGTEIIAKFKNSHIDRKPLGDISTTITTLIMGSPEVDFIFNMKYEGKEVEVNTQELKSSLDGIEVSHPAVIKVIRELFD